MRGILRILMLLVIVTLFGCKQSELCYNYPNYPKTLLAVDLSGTDYTFEDDLLSYMFIFYPVDDGVRPLEELTPKRFRAQKADDFYVTLAPGDYDVVMYSDYSGQNAFYETDDYAGIYCEAYSQATLAGNKASDGTLYAAEPDPMVVGHLSGVTIVDGGQAGGLSGQTVSVKATRATARFRAKIWMSNPRSVSSYTGYVGCVDSRYYITQERTNHGGFGIALSDENSGITISGENSDKTTVGYLTIVIDFFGFTQRGSTKYISEVDGVVSRATGVLNDVVEGDANLVFDLSLRGIAPGVQTSFELDISDYINAMELGAYDMPMIEIGYFDDPYVDLPLLIDDGEGDEDSGFHPSVGDWDDDQEFELDFGSGSITPLE